MLLGLNRSLTMTFARVNAKEIISKIFTASGKESNAHSSAGEISKTPKKLAYLLCNISFGEVDRIF